MRSEVEVMLGLLRVEESRFHHWYYHYRPSYDLGSTGEEYWRKVLAACGVDYTPELVAKLITHDVKSWTQLNQAVLNWATELKNDLCVQADRKRPGWARSFALGFIVLSLRASAGDANLLPDL